MFFSNQFADRNFAAENFLAFSHLVGGLAMLSLAWATRFLAVLRAMLVHCLLYVPTISITNSIAFANMKDAQKEFGIVRMGGTIGWILAAWPFTFILVDWDRVAAANPQGSSTGWARCWLRLTGPALQAGTQVDVHRRRHRVAAARGLQPDAAAHAAESRRRPAIAARVARSGEAAQASRSCSCCGSSRSSMRPSTICFSTGPARFSARRAAGGVGIPGNWIMPVMSIGQVAEILTMFILGVTLKKLGWRTTMIIGILGHAARFAVFAFLPQYQEIIVLINVLHGICYAFFFATVYIFVDEFFPKDVRSSAQGCST